jgi:ribonuclease HI
MGSRTNNHVEFQAILECLHCASNYNVFSLQVFRDSNFSIDSMNAIVTLDNLELQNNGIILKTLSTSFQNINFCHIFKELNTYGDYLSKDTINMEENKIYLEEFFDGVLSSHRYLNIYTL